MNSVVHDWGMYGMHDRSMDNWYAMIKLRPFMRERFCHSNDTLVLRLHKWCWMVDDMARLIRSGYGCVHSVNSVDGRSMNDSWLSNVSSWCDSDDAWCDELWLRNSRCEWIFSSRKSSESWALLKRVSGAFPTFIFSTQNIYFHCYASINTYQLEHFELIFFLF